MDRLLAIGGIKGIILIGLPLLVIQLYHRVHHQAIISEVPGLIQVVDNEEE